MLLVRTKVKPSSIDGLGLYAEEDVRYGEIIEIVETKFSYKVFTQKQVNKFNKIQLQYEHDYMFKLDNKYYSTIDQAKYMNHSNTPNVSWHKAKKLANEKGIIGYFTANKDIAIGEEITVDYREFCEKGTDFDIS